MFLSSPDRCATHVAGLDDNAIVVDVLPQLIAALPAAGAEREDAGAILSLSACVELLPSLDKLLSSPFEDYKLVRLLCPPVPPTGPR